MNCDEKLLQVVKSMREQKINKISNSTVIGEEIFIPTRDGETRALIYSSKTLRAMAPVFFDVHGGGFVMGVPEHDDKFCDTVRNELGITVISIDYRLAPEYKCPTDKNDVYDVVKYVSSNSDKYGIDPNNMAIGGHSAGANISTVVCMMAKAQKEFSFKYQVLDYPPLDVATPAKEKFYTEGAILPEIAETFDKCYRTEEYAKNPYCSPVFASTDELKDLPPAMVITCEIDSLRDEGEDYAQKLIKAGVETTAKRFYGVAHGFTISKADLPQSKEAWRMIIEGLKNHLLN